MPSRQEKQRERIDKHITGIVEEHEPGCPVCEEPMLREQGMFSMIGTKPRMPRTFGSLKCPKCGYVMFFELPDLTPKERRQP